MQIEKIRAWQDYHSLSEGKSMAPAHGGFYTIYKSPLSP